MANLLVEIINLPIDKIPWANLEKYNSQCNGQGTTKLLLEMLQFFVFLMVRGKIGCYVYALTDKKVQNFINCFM